MMGLPLSCTLQLVNWINKWAPLCLEIDLCGHFWWQCLSTQGLRQEPTPLPQIKLHRWQQWDNCYQHPDQIIMHFILSIKTYNAYSWLKLNWEGLVKGFSWNCFHIAGTIFDFRFIKALTQLSQLPGHASKPFNLTTKHRRILKYSGSVLAGSKITYWETEETRITVQLPTAPGKGEPLFLLPGDVVVTCAPRQRPDHKSS